MAMFEINTNPTDRQLRQFGLLCIVALPAIVWMWGGSSQLIQAAAFLGTTLGLLGLAAPHLLKPVFVGMIFLTLPIGLIVGELIMLMIYFGLFLPMALVFRIIGRDVLQRRSSRDADSFWQPRTPPRSVRKYYQQS